MASGASCTDAAAKAMMDTTSPRQKKRWVTGNTGPAAAVSPIPKRYTPGASATASEISLSEVANDHAFQLETVIKVVRVLANSDSEHGDKFQAITDKDTELKEKLKLLEAQMTTANTAIESNDRDMKNKLQLIEAQLHDTARALDTAASVQDMSELARLMDNLPTMEQRVDDSLKGFERQIKENAEQSKQELGNVHQQQQQVKEDVNERIHVAEQEIMKF